MSRLTIRDNIDIELPSLIGIHDNKERISIKDSSLSEHSVLKDKALRIVVDATHCGYFNHNNFYYVHDGMAASVSSFVTPYLKPALIEHEGEVIPIGRVHEAAFVPIQDGVFDRNAPDIKNRGVPTGKIRITSLITDEDGIKKITKAQFLTVSTGGGPTAMPVCSICDEPVKAYMGRPVLSCDHIAGRVEDGKFTGIVIPGVNYDEYSFVNHPADYSSQHFAGVVDMQLIDYDYSQHRNLKTYDGVAKRELVFIDKMNKEEKMATEDKNVQNSAQPETNTDSQENKNTSTEDVKDFSVLYEDAVKALEECDDCDEDITSYWSNIEDSILEEVKNLDTELTDVYEMILGDALSKEKRKDLPDSAFCGPDRTFPVDTCDRGSTALAMIEFPKVKAKYSDSTLAKIKACIMNKGKKMDCSFTKNDSKTKDSVDTSELNAKVKELEAECKKLKEKNKTLNEKLESDSGKTEAADAKIIELTGQLKDNMADRIIDLSIYAKHKVVDSIRNAETDEDREKAYTDVKNTFKERSNNSLKDKLSDLVLEVNSSRFEISDTIEDKDPVRDDSEEINDPFLAAVKDRKEKKSSSSGKDPARKLFPEEGQE